MWKQFNNYNNAIATCDCCGDSIEGGTFGVVCKMISEGWIRVTWNHHVYCRHCIEKYNIIHEPTVKITIENS